MTEAELTEAEAMYLEGMADQLRQRAKQLRELGQESADAALVANLESLPFKLAKSGKCDWVGHDQVSNEVLALFDSKGDFKTETFHYRKMQDGNILRFQRGAKA